MSRFLITGGAGFLGINLCRYLVERGHEVTTFDLAEFDYPDMAGKVRSQFAKTIEARPFITGPRLAVAFVLRCRA